jgi:excisionase family DNA binding protein
MAEKLLTVEQVADYLQVVPATVRTYINDKDHPLPAVFLGKRGGYRISQRDLDIWLDERKKRGKDEIRND